MKARALPHPAAFAAALSLLLAAPSAHAAAVIANVNGINQAIGSLSASNGYFQNNPATNDIQEAGTFTLDSADNSLMSDAMGCQFRWFQIVLAADGTTLQYNMAALNFPITDPPNGGYDGSPDDTLPFYENNAEYNTDSRTSATGLGHNQADGVSITYDHPHLNNPAANGMLSFQTYLVFSDPALVAAQQFDVLEGYSWGGQFNAQSKLSSFSGPTFIDPAAFNLNFMTTALDDDGFKGWTPIVGYNVAACVPEASPVWLLAAGLLLLLPLAARRRRARPAAGGAAAALGLLLLGLAPSHALPPPQPVVPVDSSWDWTGCQRILYYTFAAPNAAQDATQFVVKPNPYVSPPALEPDPTPGDNQFTIADAFVRAADAWNAANTGWMLVDASTVPAPKGAPVINVRMGTVSIPAMNGNPPIPGEFYPTPPSGSQAPNDADMPGVPPTGAPVNAQTLAFFQLLGMPDAMGNYAQAQIVFNPTVDWGVDNNANNAADPTTDPIVVALHEIGHGLRLDHYTDPNDTVISVNAANGAVMRPITAAGVHTVNPNLTFARNPGAADITAATTSANLKNCVPEPSPLALAALALPLLALRLRRRAA